MTDHYYSKNPESEFTLETISTNFFGHDLKINSSNGIFSKKRIDRNSRILIENCRITNETEVLDLGCGYGIIGIAISKEYNLAKITFSDVNYRAVSLTKDNCKVNQIKNYKTIQSDGFEKIKDKFDTILLNPPQTAGKQLCFDLITESINFLKPNGTLQIVARHKKGGKVLSEKMEEVFGNLETLTKSGGSRVYLSTKIE